MLTVGLSPLFVAWQLRNLNSWTLIGYATGALLGQIPTYGWHVATGIYDRLTGAEPVQVVEDPGLRLAIYPLVQAFSTAIVTAAILTKMPIPVVRIF